MTRSEGIAVTLFKPDIITLLLGIAPKINVDLCLMMEKEKLMRETGGNFGGPDFRFNVAALEKETTEKLWELYLTVKPKE